MNEFLKWLTAGSTLATVFALLLGGTVVAIYAIAFYQDREVSFWPPRVGGRPERTARQHETRGSTTSEEVEAKVFTNYRTVDWPGLLKDAHSIDMAVTYFDSWVKSSWEPLLEFYRRGGHIRIILTDPEAVAIDIAWERFKRYEREQFIEHVKKTPILLQQVLDDSKSSSALLQVFYLKEALNYAAIRIDNSRLLLSFYEHDCKTRVRTPAFMLDLTSSQTLREYWSGEFALLFKESRQVDGHHST